MSALISVLELYSTQGVHAHFVRGVIQNLEGFLDRISIDRGCLDEETRVIENLRILRAPHTPWLREVYYAAIALRERLLRPHRTLVTGAGVLAHLVIAFTWSPRVAAVVIHSEFARAKRNRSLGDRARRVALRRYSRRGFHLVVLSSATRDGVLGAGLYRPEHLHVLTHPLLPMSVPPRAGRVETAALLGLIRPQKICNLGVALPALRNRYTVDFVLLGKGMGVRAEELRDFFREIDLRPDRYDAQEETSFIARHSVGALVFLPGAEYALTTSGTVCDATRLGCYVIGTTDSFMARELIGELYNPVAANMHHVDSGTIQACVDERKTKNVRELQGLLGHLADEG